MVHTLSDLANEGTVVYLAHQSRSRICDDALMECLAEFKLEWTVVPGDEMHPVYQKDVIAVYRIVRCHD
jgi:hypothetical protein